MLILVSTPIGNLEDISYRAIESLRSAKYILAEDTRHTGRLLCHYEIQTPLKSFHQLNEARREREILADLSAGWQICLVSDAGTPTISDPGKRLVQACIQRGISLYAIPGACAFLTALVISPFPSEPFQFLGFLPKKKQRRMKLLQEALSYSGTTLAYESPHRLLQSLEMLAQLEPLRLLFLSRELTKRYEESTWGTSRELLIQWQRKDKIRGEWVLLISSPGFTLPSLS